MTTTQRLEYRISRKLLRRRDAWRPGTSVEGLILGVAIVACLGALAALVPGLVWVMLLGSLVLTLGLQ